MLQMRAAQLHARNSSAQCPHPTAPHRHGLEIPIRSRYLIDLGDTPLSQWLLWLKGFVVDRVTKTTYLALR